MRVRAIDSNHDWTFGAGVNNYKTQKYAVSQEIDTRLNSFLGHCFFDLGAGLNWFLYCGGSKDQIGLNLAISSVIINTENVLSLVQLSVNLNVSTRKFTVSYQAMTVYGLVQSTVVPPTFYLTDETGSILETESGERNHRMKKFLLSLLFLVSMPGFADVKISQLPLGAASSSQTGDSFPYVFTGTSPIATQRLLESDLPNLPSFVSTYLSIASAAATYAPLVSPVITGTLTVNSTTFGAYELNSTDSTGNAIYFEKSGTYNSEMGLGGSNILTGSAITDTVIRNESGNIYIANGDTKAVTIDASSNETVKNNITSTSGIFTGNGSGLTNLVATNLSSGTVNPNRLPNPTATSIGGVESIAAVAHNFLTSISTSGVPAQAQPSCSDLSGVAASCSVDTTVATNISSGTLNPNRLPNPSATNLGGVESLATVTHNFLTSISTSGVPTQAQPSCSDLSGVAASCSTDTTNAGNISSGTISDSRLPSSMATKTFTGVTSYPASSSIDGSGNIVFKGPSNTLGSTADPGSAKATLTVQGSTTAYSNASGLTVNAGSSSSDFTAIFANAASTANNLVIAGNGNVTVGANEVVGGAATGSTTTLKIETANAGNPTLAIQMLNSTVVSGRPNWQIGTNQNLNGVLEITPSTADGGSTWSGTSAIQFGVTGSTGSYVGSVKMPGLATSSSAATGSVCWTTGGNLTVDTTLACLSSTGKIKEYIEPLTDGLAEVMALRPVSYNLKPEFNPEHLGRMVGLIAEEVNKVDPRLVSANDKGEMLGVRYMQMTALLIKAIQEQQAEIEELKRAR